MSFRVLVIPEDPTNNGYILRPLVQAILADAGRSAARVHVLTNPRLRGYDEALRAIRDDLPRRYGHFDLWLFFPDADRASEDSAAALERELGARRLALLCCPAQPEVEVFACAPFRREIRQNWEAARRDPRFKQEVFEPLLRAHGDERRPGGGRDLMIERAIRNLPLLFQMCPELKDLRERIEQFLNHPEAGG
ncbi:MAG: hypothetical protein H7A45_03170 [Verrucomicrobiales bacterium]|nr:hypothetical protein [Verrucomicrobiales bacterium]MCP5527806.1 hypothetical protein [Verrucomicrobiales bacterium]